MQLILVQKLNQIGQSIFLCHTTSFYKPTLCIFVVITDFVFQLMAIGEHGRLGVLVLKLVAQEVVSELAIVMIHHR